MLWITSLQEAAKVVRSNLPGKDDGIVIRETIGRSAPRCRFEQHGEALVFDRQAILRDDFEEFVSRLKPTAAPM